MSLSPKQMVIDYFHFVDTADLGSILKLLTRDCVFTVETHGVRLKGDEEISAMFERLWDHHQWVKHDQFHFVEETSGNDIAVRFRVTNKLKDGELVNKSNCNFFTIQDGQFSAGNTGRPKGSRNKATLAIESLLQGQAEALTQTAVTKALEGDSVALRLCMERIAPAPKDQPVSFSLP